MKNSIPHLSQGHINVEELHKEREHLLKEILIALGEIRLKEPALFEKAVRLLCFYHTYHE